MMNKVKLFNAKNAGQKIEKGMKIEVVEVGTFADVDKDGHDVTVVALEAKDGTIYTTISNTISRAVDLLSEILQEQGTVTVKVNEAESNNGRSFYTLEIVG